MNSFDPLSLSTLEENPDLVFQDSDDDQTNVEFEINPEFEFEMNSEFLKDWSVQSLLNLNASLGPVI